MKRPAAALTITRNEPFWLRVWCNYYCNVFPQSSVYVLDNSTSDGSVEEIRQIYPEINIISVPNEFSFDHVWLKNTVERHQAELLKPYDVVLFAETDEFLIIDSQDQNIYDYCVAFAHSTLATQETSLRAIGWGIVHQIDTEPALNKTPGSLLLEQLS